MDIHPTAIINPAAQIADDVKIGPYVCIDGHAVIGPGCVIQAHAPSSPGTVRMGRDNLVGYGAIIGAEPQDHAFNPKIHSEVIIGDHNSIREYCTIHRGSEQDTATVMGDHNLLMAGAHLGHNTKVGNHVIIANSVLLAGHVEVMTTHTWAAARSSTSMCASGRSRSPRAEAASPRTSPRSPWEP